MRSNIKSNVAVLVWRLKVVAGSVVTQSEPGHSWVFTASFPLLDVT